MKNDKVLVLTVNLAEGIVATYKPRVCYCFDPSCVHCDMTPLCVHCDTYNTEHNKDCIVNDAIDFLAKYNKPQEVNF